MNAGIIGVLMHQLPYQFSGLQNVLSNIAYLVDLVLFVAFSIIMILRITMYPRSTAKIVTSSTEELCYFSCIPIALLTIAELTALQVSTAYWGGYAFSLVAYVLWWIGAGSMVTLSLAIYITIFKIPLVEDRTAPTALFIPAVGTATVATSGGLITMYAYNIAARLSVPVLILSYILVGQGIFLAVMIYTIFTHRLMTKGWPEAPKIPSLALLVGPMGQSATALQLLGTAANTGQKFSGYHKGTFLQSNPAMALDAAGILISMMLFGFGIFWVCILVWALLETAYKREHSFTMTWWSTIFPIGKLSLECIRFSFCVLTELTKERLPLLWRSMDWRWTLLRGMCSRLRSQSSLSSIFLSAQYSRYGRLRRASCYYHEGASFSSLRTGKVVWIEGRQYS